jgi:hypothetical protein
MTNNTDFTATHLWTTDGLKIPVVLDGGEVYDASHAWARNEGRSGVAQYGADDYDADGREILAVRVNGKISGTLRAIE